MRLNRFWLVFLVVVGIVGCKQDAKEAPQSAKVSVVQNLVSPAGKSSALPHLTSNGHTAILSWVETHGDTLATLLYSELVAGAWQEPQTIVKGSDWFVNWADYPMIAENNGNLWAHVLQKSAPDTYAYAIKTHVKPKGAENWTTNVALHTDGTPTEHGFVSVVPYKDNFFVNWLDGRNTLENEAGERGAMTLRAGVVSANGALLQEYELDNSTCDCCQTTAAITDNGPVVLYRDRSPEEVRDIAIVRQIDGEFTAPKIIHADNWQIKGCPVNGPKVAALGNNLAVGWFTAVAQNPKIQVMFSSDGGATFRAPIEIATGKVLGRVDVVLLDATTALVSWVASNETETTFMAVKVTASGEKAEPVIITRMDSSRKSGFPQMELVNDKVLFAWTNVLNGSTTVQTAYVEVTGF